jgi:hypothetical protein
LTPAFDTFIAIDWSGASKLSNGIAVAKCELGKSAPRLIGPDRKSHWTRTAIAEWLDRELDSGQSLLIGFDFAFGLPFETDQGYLGGKARQIQNIFDLWSLIEDRSDGDPDYGCAAFIDDPRYASLFWKSGPRPETWIERKRKTEFACAEATQTYPDTVYKLLGSKQVGKASITGIRLLHRIRSSRKKRVSFWPFEEIRSSAIVEIYPTLFRKSATGSINKVRSLSDLNSALARFDSNPLHPRALMEFSDHETDALISAAGLRSFAALPSTWDLNDTRTPLARREGWIFGVRT